MIVIAHAADALFVAPVLVVVVYISLQAIRDRRRDGREAQAIPAERDR